MIRSWAVRPDDTGVVTREALFAALADAATLLDIAGGCLEVVVGRMPTGVPNEMVMDGAMLMWRDRTDAKPQPERAVSVTPEPVNGEAKARFMAEMDAIDADLNQPESASLDQPESEHASVEPDGFDMSRLEEEDIDEPVAAR